MVLPNGNDPQGTSRFDSPSDGREFQTTGGPLATQVIESADPAKPMQDGSTQHAGGNQGLDGPALPFRPSKRPPMAHLDVCHDYQNTFTTIALRKERSVIGRVSGEVTIEHDKLISSQHAEIIRYHEDDIWHWMLRDLESTNGTFAMIQRAVLKDGDELMIGSNHYRFTQVGSEVHLEHIVGGDPVDGISLDREGSWIGRDRVNELEAFSDPLLDFKHAWVSIDRKKRWVIKNAGSTNGIWYRIKEIRLRPHAAFQLGEQRFVFRG